MHQKTYFIKSVRRKGEKKKEDNCLRGQEKIGQKGWEEISKFGLEFSLYCLDRKV